MAGISVGYKPGGSGGTPPEPPKLQEKSVSINSNGNSSIIPDSGYDGLSKVDITTSILGGGENIISNKNQVTQGLFWRGLAGAVVSFDGEIIKAVSGELQYPSLRNYSLEDYVWELNEDYVLQFDIRSNDSQTRLVGIRSGQPTNPIILPYQTIVTSNEFIHYEIPFKSQYSGATGEASALLFTVSNPDWQVGSDWIEIKNVKVEKGKIATPYTLSLQDEYGYGMALESILNIGNFEYNKINLLNDYINSYELTKNWDTIPSRVYENFNVDIKYMPDIPLGKINEESLCAYSALRDVPPSVYSSTFTSLIRAFSDCSSLTKIGTITTISDCSFYAAFNRCSALEEVDVDLQKSNNIGYCFYNCFNLKKINSTNSVISDYWSTASYAFSNCYSLTEINNFLLPNTISFASTFSGCKNLTKVSNIDMSSASTVGNMFGGCTSLSNMNFIGTFNVTNLNLTSCPLTVDSMLSLFGVLVDLTSVTSKNIQLGATNIAKLSPAQIAIATNKNWTLS